jgi:hypothetical protein
MKLGFVLGAVLAATSLVACGGGDDEPKAKPATVNEATAKQTATATVQAMATVIAQNNGQSAASAVLGMGMMSMGMITPQAQGAMAAGKCECDEVAKTCVFEDCGEGGSVMNGTFSWADNHIVCDLSMTLDGAESGGAYAAFSYSTTCDLTLTETSIDGEIAAKLDVEYNQGGQSGSVKMQSETEYMDVTFDATTKQPTGGSVHVWAKVESSQGNYEGEATVSLP